MLHTLRFSLCALGALLVSAPLARAEEAPKTASLPSSLLVLAGYAPLQGEGVVVMLSDRELKPQPKTKFALPGLVHDYDVLALVNELRAAGARGISVGGVRLTNQSAIRCVGPAILVGGQQIAVPVRVEAVGNAVVLQKALTMPGGLVVGMKGSGPQVETKIARQLRLPAAPLPR